MREYPSREGRSESQCHPLIFIPDIDRIGRVFYRPTLYEFGSFEKARPPSQPRARLRRLNGTNSLADTKRCVQKKKTRGNETDEKMTLSTTHTATKRRPAITKGPAEREADEPTREDKDDVGPSARAAAGKRASTASTKVRRHTVLVCVFLCSTRDALDTNTDDRPDQTVGTEQRFSPSFCFFNRATRIRSTSSTGVDQSISR